MGILKRLSAAPLSIRYYQVTNGVINWMLGERMNILHVAEYPRCGGTWTRHMMQDAMDVQQYAYDRMLTKNTIIQCHSLPNSQIRKAVVVLRDPRDSIVSFYHKKIAFDKSISGKSTVGFANYRHDPDLDVQEDFANYLESHLTTPEHPRFTFNQFAKAWMKQSNTCVVRYENFKVDPVAELEKITIFAGKQISKEKLTEAVEKNSFANRTKQRSGKSRKPGQSDAGQFERKGIVGDWKNLFNQRAKDTFLKYEGETLKLLEYETNENWAN